MILHLLRMRRNVGQNVFNDQKNVSAIVPPAVVLFTWRILLEAGKKKCKPCGRLGN